MFGLGMTELVVIMIICLLVFGGSKISGIGRSLGEAITEFKDAVKPEKEEKPQVRDDHVKSAPQQAAAASEPAADEEASAAPVHDGAE